MSENEKSQKIQRRVVLIGMGGILLAMGVATVGTTTSHRAVLAEQEQQIGAVTQEINESRARAEVSVNSAIEDATGGQAGRISQDEPLVREVATTALTWDSGESFAKARETLLADYGMKGSEQFFTSFMPEARFNEDAEGKRFYALDASGANSSSGTIEIHLVSAKGDAYRYLAEVDTAITSDAVTANDSDPEDVTVHRTTLIGMTVHGDGSVTDLEGVAPGDATLTSR